jgi:thiamine-phosphate pyrophosphorylase
VSTRAQRLARARLYLVCDRPSERLLRATLAGGVDIVQLRMKDASDREILAAGALVRRLCAEYGALFILNDRPDLVATAGADGVHVGQDDVPVADARAAVGQDRLVGLSTHSPAQIEAAGGGRAAGGGKAAGGGEAAGGGAHRVVDYIGVGPVFETPTKPGRPAVGLGLVTYAAAHARVPFFAIGGIDASNVEAVAAAGARRVAVVRALTEAPDPAAAAAVLRRSLEHAARARGEGAREAKVGAAQP